MAQMPFLSHKDQHQKFQELLLCISLSLPLQLVCNTYTGKVGKTKFTPFR